MTVLINDRLSTVLRDEEEFYVANNPRSQAAYRRAIGSLPGGNTRTVLHYSPFPLQIVRGDTIWVHDADHHVYVDFLGEFSAGLYGHNHPIIIAAISDALRSGIALGGPNLYEAELGAQLGLRFPSIELVRFCNSGTEANLFALLAARAVTGRNRVLVFDGAYHGGCLAFDERSSRLNAPFEFLRGRYNDVENAHQLIAENSDDLAAVIVEPMLNAGGCIPASRRFVQALRDGCYAEGAVLIFDEVVTSRLAPGGLQGQFAITPDLTTLGKYLGGGLSFGAFGGRSEIMAHFDPRRNDAISHPGTFNNNVCSMAAGLAGLKHVFTSESCEQLNEQGERLRVSLNQVARKHSANVQVTGIGSIMQLHFTRAPIHSPDDLAQGRTSERIEELAKLYHLFMLRNKIYVARRGSINLMLGIGRRETDLLVEAVDSFLREYGALIADARTQAHRYAGGRRG